MERWLPRLYREQLVEAVDAGAIRLERLPLADREVKDPKALAHLNGRWSSTSPLHRAGNAVFAYLLERGTEPAMVHLHGRDVENDVTPYFAGFGLRYLDAMQRCLTEHGGKEWIEVVPPPSGGTCSRSGSSPSRVRGSRRSDGRERGRCYFEASRNGL
ncbi:hypothetical protein [Actinoplanes auranticolor]|uniref:Uncharacterized protein n=1 Tax=Actinoplanes auranticolor TaxID=47988 RepID=A0A919SQ99_9ACTN|nr:hypothetical protein [Actinoplanes auranticolor]GIM76411.1 hypothetical protein Aau02nite_70730 [Actinoplanes auranticolor]